MLKSPPKPHALIQKTNVLLFNTKIRNMKLKDQLSLLASVISTHRLLLSQGTAIGKCPKNKLLKGYIELELQLREFDRCRKLYEKYLEFSPENCTTWIKFAELETILGDIDRARGIFELAIGQPRLDMPEVSSSPSDWQHSRKRTQLCLHIKPNFNFFLLQT